MSMVCRECRWTGTPGPGEVRCPACRTFLPPASRNPQPPTAAAPGAVSLQARPPLRPRRPGSFLLGMGIAGAMAVAAARVYAPDLVTFARAKPSADPENTPVAAAASVASPATAAPAPAPAQTPGIPPGAPPAALAAREVQGYLPPGYTSAGAPALAGASAAGLYEYRVPLRAPRTLYRVRVVSVTLEAGAPALLRENRESLVLHPGLGPGRAYAVDAARQATRSGEQVDGTWRVRLSRQGDTWGVVRADPVSVAGLAGDDGSALLTEDALAEARAARREALERYTARARAVERDVESLRAGALREVPQRCGRDVSALLGEVVRLASDCPALAASERSSCLQRRDRMNDELGACERQNQLHDQRSEAARRIAAVRSAERRAGFARELAREADDHRRRSGG